MLDRPTNSCVRFGAFEADLRTGELRKRGLKIRLEGQPMQVLVLLLERPGELVTREEVKQRLWPANTFVDFEVSINAAVKRLRQALGDSAETPRFIETLPRRGYRFIYPIEPEEPLSAAPWYVRRRVAVLAGAAAISVVLFWSSTWLARYHGRPELTSLAVLPFENLTGEPEQEYFVDGLHDELITELAQISALKVISRTSVLRYKQQKKPLPEIARELGVDGIVEGTVRVGGDRVRMTVQLISAKDDRHLWAQSYDTDPHELPRLPGLIAWSMAKKLHIELTAQERTLLDNAKGVDPAASRAYFKAHYYASKVTREHLWKAIGYFHEALDADPSYAPAWAGLGECYERLASQAQENTLAQAKEALEKAVALDPLLREPHQALGRLKLAAWDWEGAAREFQRAHEVDPSWEGPELFLLVSGQAEKAVAAARRSAALDPLTYGTQLSAGWTYFMAGHYDEAIAQWQKTARLDPNIHHAYYELAWGYTKKRMFPDAIRECETALAKLQQKQPDARVVASCGWVYAAAGRRNEALEIARQLEANRGEGASIAAAHAYDALGDHERALEVLTAAYKDHDARLPRQWLSPMLSNEIKADTRFQELIRRTGNPWARFPTAGATRAATKPPEAGSQ